MPFSKVRSIRDLPGPSGIPVLGNVFQLDTSQAHLQFEQWAREFGSPYRISLGHKKLVIWSDVDIAQAVLRERPHTFRRGGRISEVLNEISMAGLFAAEGEDWFYQRELIAQGLHGKHLADFYPVLCKIAERLRSRLAHAADAGQSVDMLRELTGFTVDAICSFAFGLDPNTLEQGDNRIQNHLGQIFPMFTKRLLAPFPYWRWLRMPRDRRLDRSLQEVHAFVQSLIDDARSKARPVSSNLLETLILLEKETGTRVTDEFIIANVLTLLLAGEDTTAHTLAWSVFHLCQHQELQTQLADTLLDDTPAKMNAPDYETLKKQDLLEGLTYEALRLKPVVGMLSISPIKDAIIGDVMMPANSLAYFLLRPSMMASKHFSYPQEFKPSRWIEKDSTGNTHDRRAFLQFGAGPRVCPGRQLANIEMRLVLSMVLRNFRMELGCKAEEIKEVCSFTITPSKMPVRVYRR